jgi:uncharacterized membrane protein
MTANGWILRLHLIALFFWIGNLLVLSRLMAFYTEQPEEMQQRLLPLAQRIWRVAVSPSGALVLITGLMMLHGVGTPRSVGDSLSWYFKPRLPDGEPSLWYVTFHVKLVAFAVIMFSDFWIGRQIYRVANGRMPAPGWPLGALLALGGILVGLVGTWVSLSALGIPYGRQVGYGVGFLLAAGGFIGGRKLGASGTKARYWALHGLVAVLVLLIVTLVIAKPLQNGAAL